MNKIPKIVYDRLRTLEPKGAHPEADLLTAFAEQSLSATERDAVLEHMARCGDCREIVALALPDAAGVALPIAADSTEEVAASVSRMKVPALRKPIFVWAWPQLRWAALAAGVAVAASVLLLNPGKVNHPNLPSSSQIATTVPPTSQPVLTSPPTALPSTDESAKQPSRSQSPTRQSVRPSTKPLAVAPSPQPASPQTTLPSIATPTAQFSARPSMLAGKADNARLNGSLNSGSLNSGSKVSRQLQTGEAALPSYPIKSEVLIADNAKNSSDKASTTLPQEARALDQGASSASGAAEAAAVSGAAVGAQKQASGGNIMMAQNNAPAIVKAKEPPPAVAANGRPKGEAGAAGSVSAQGRNVMSLANSAVPSGSAGPPAVTWTIAAGVLQRSLDSGQTWQTALRTDHRLLCSATRDTDVWAGGQAGTLFHSTDSGLTWAQVKPSIKNQQLSSDVTHIDVRSSTQALLSTGNNEIWITLDGGTTWSKK